MKKGIIMILTLAMLLSLAACGTAADTGNENDSSYSSGQVSTEEVGEENESPDTEAAAAEASDTEISGVEESKEAAAAQSNSNILVAYFSQTCEQYGVGVIEEGNTSIIAHMIAEQTGADLFEIEAAVAYPENLDELLDVSEQEKADNARSEIASTIETMEDYDTVFVGYPNWWGDMPMIVYTFLESYDFSGKTVIPFCTHGGSGLAGTESTIAEITGASMLDGFAIPGTTAQNDRGTAQAAVDEWLQEIGFAVNNSND